MTFVSSLTRLFNKNKPLTNRDTFSHLYRETHVVVFRYIYGLHGEPQAAVEDLTAETFLRAWKARHRFEGQPDAALGWLLTIARRLVIDGHRHRQAHGFEVDIDTMILDSQQPGLDTQAIKHEEADALLSLLQHLPTEQREILVLRYMLGWRVKDIAAHVSQNENTVSVTIRRTLASLRREWQQSRMEA